MTLQLPAERVQLVELKLPVLFEVKVTMPVGVIAPVPEVSVTVTVQVEGAPVLTLAGAHVNPVLEDLIVDARVNCPELLAWLESPA